MWRWDGLAVSVSASCKWGLNGLVVKNTFILWETQNDRIIQLYLRKISESLIKCSLQTVNICEHCVFRKVIIMYICSGYLEIRCSRFLPYHYSMCTYIQNSDHTDTDTWHWDKAPFTYMTCIIQTGLHSYHQGGLPNALSTSFTCYVVGYAI